jgi:hypothetical protein
MYKRKQYVHKKCFSVLTKTANTQLRKTTFLDFAMARVEKVSFVFGAAKTK